MKEIWKKFKEVVYIFTIIGILIGWIVQYKVSKRMDELENQAQNVKIELLEEENAKLKLKTDKQDGYIQENANNIDWVIRIFIDSE